MAQVPSTYFAPSIQSGKPANQTAPASTSLYKMQGLGQLITPSTPTGNILALFQATMNASATTVGNGVNLQLYYGAVVSGVAIPVNAGAIPSNAVALGNIISCATGVTLTTAANLLLPVTMHGVAPGLTPGQQYWFDVAAESVTTASQNALINATFSLLEI